LKREVPKTAVVEVVEVLSEVVVSSSEVVVVEDVLSLDADEPPSSLPQEIMVRLKRDIRKMEKHFFIFTPTSKVKYYWLR